MKLKAIIVDDEHFVRDDLRDRNVVLTMCGSNIDWSTFAEQVCFPESHAH